MSEDTVVSLFGQGRGTAAAAPSTRKPPHQEAGKNSPASDDEALEALAARFDRLDRRAARVAGKVLLQEAAIVHQIHEIFTYRRSEGGFIGYMERRLGRSSTASYRLLDVHKRFGKDGECLPIWETLSHSAIYLLAAGSTPEEAVAEIIERVGDGKPPPAYTEVQKIIARTKRRAALRGAAKHTKPGDSATRESGVSRVARLVISNDPSTSDSTIEPALQARVDAQEPDWATIAPQLPADKASFFIKHVMLTTKNALKNELTCNSIKAEKIATLADKIRVQSKDSMILEWATEIKKLTNC